MEQQTGSKLGKEYVKSVYCHPAYLTYMQSTSCKMPECIMKLKLESRLTGEISITSDMQMTLVYGKNQRGTKDSFAEVWLRTQHSKTKIIAYSPITSWQIYGETMETVTDYLLGLQNHCRQWLKPWN